MVAASRWEWALGLLASFALGTIASGFAWWTLLKVFTPRLQTSVIAKDADDREPSGSRYRVKVRNRSRRYLVRVVQVNARLSAKGLDDTRPENRPGIVVPCGTEHLHPVIATRTGRVYTLHIERLEGRDSLALVPDDVRRQLPSMSLEELLELTADVELRFFITVAHGMSGFERTYALHFTKNDIKVGKFRKNSIDIVSLNDPSGSS